MGSRVLEYTFNQKAAVVAVLFAAVWAFLSMKIAIGMELQSGFTLVIFGIMTIIAWIMVPLYIKRLKSAYIIGTVLLILGLVGLIASPGDPLWYTFANPISVIKQLLFIIDSIVGIYFSLKSYKEF